MDLTRAEWRKSSRSGDNGGNCVEVARNLPRVVAVRDSKNPHGPALTVEFAGWRDFIADVKAGRHDLTRAEWRKSTRSGSNGGACVEVARNLPYVVAVRDSKNPHGPVLTVESAGWRSFIADVKAGGTTRPDSS